MRNADDIPVWFIQAEWTSFLNNHCACLGHFIPHKQFQRMGMESGVYAHTRSAAFKMIGILSTASHFG